MNTDLELANIDQAKVLQALGLNINDPKAQATLLLCQKYDLDPFLGQMQLVQNKPYITRDGYLHIAHRSNVFNGMELVEEGTDDRGWYCVVAVYRKDMSRPFTAKGRVKKGEKTQADPEDMALTRAERRALRRAFDVAGVPDIDDADIVPLKPGEQPFDVEVVAEQQALPAATSKAAAQKRQTVIEAGEALKDKDPISAQEVEQLLARVAGFDDEHKAMAADQMRTYGLSLKRDRVTRLEARSIVQVLDAVESFQADAWEERRRAVFASLPEGITEEERHSLIDAATVNVPEGEGGQTDSTKRLTDAQAQAVLDYLEQQAEAS